MDELKKRLQADAAAIEAVPTPEFERRLDASLAAVREERRDLPVKENASRMWWFSSLAGITAALLIIFLLNLQQPSNVPDANQDPVQVNNSTTPEYSPERDPYFNPDAIFATGAITEPLEAEMSHLQSDLERVRKTLEEDLDLAF